MKLSCLTSAVLLAVAGLSFASAPAVAASDIAAGRTTVSEEARTQLALAFSAARDFRPRGERALYELGREDAEMAMRAADSRAVTKTDRTLAGEIRSYFSARDACRRAETVNDYGICEARVSEKLGEKIAASLRQAAARTASRATVIAAAEQSR